MKRRFRSPFLAPSDNTITASVLLTGLIEKICRFLIAYKSDTILI